MPVTSESVGIMALEYMFVWVSHGRQREVLDSVTERSVSDGLNFGHPKDLRQSLLDKQDWYVLIGSYKMTS
jgi:hypothetical protein